MKNTINLDLLSMREKRDALTAAKEKLSQDDQIIIDGMTAEIIDSIKAKSPASQLSPNGALEVLAKIGMFMNGGIR